MTQTKAFPDRSKNLIAFLGALALFLGLLQILTFIFFSKETDNLVKISQEKENLLSENARLEREIVKLTSLPLLEEKAQEIGFVTPGSQTNSQPLVIYLSEQAPIASNLKWPKTD